MRKHRPAPEAMQRIGPTMPPLDHYPNRPAPFDPANSEVLKWIASQPDLLDCVMKRLASRGYIRFDAETQRWVGRDFRGTDATPTE